MIRTTRLLGLAGALALAAVALPAAAAECKGTIEANDAMQFSAKAINVPASCKQYTLTLKHTGKLPATAMGHNVVISRTADLNGVAADGMGAGVANSYVKPGDARAIAHSKVVGGGQSTTVTIPVAKLKAGESYSFFCSFPGHSSIMKGTVNLTK